MKTQTIVAGMLATFGLFASACGDGTGPANGMPQATLSFVTRAAPAPAMAMVNALRDETLVDGQNTLVITSAEVVLREIELKRISANCDQAVNEDDCEEFDLGPVLLDLPLDGQVKQSMAITVEPGTYRELEFEIHKVTSDQEDATFRAAHPDMEGVSIRVQGTYNGNAFTYTTDLDVEQEFDFTEPLVVTEGTTSFNVTVLLDLDAWFRDGTGNLVDPATGNTGEVNEGLIKENIKQSTEAFEDDDHDGDDDAS